MSKQIRSNRSSRAAVALSAGLRDTHRRPARYLRAMPVIAALLVLSACAGGSQGWYHDQAVKECQARGLAAGNSEFDACVQEREDSIYKYWMDKMRSWG